MPSGARQRQAGSNRSRRNNPGWNYHNVNSMELHNLHLHSTDGSFILEREN